MKKINFNLKSLKLFKQIKGNLLVIHGDKLDENIEAIIKIAMSAEPKLTKLMSLCIQRMEIQSLP